MSRAETMRRRRQLGDEDYRVLAQFRRMVRGFLAFSAEGAEERGLTSQQHQAMLALRAHQGAEAMTIGELAAELLIKNHSAIGLVDRLVEGGYVIRRESQRDRRRVLVSLTPAGEIVLEAISIRNLGQLGRGAGILQQLLQTTQALESADTPRNAKLPPA